MALYFSSLNSGSNGNCYYIGNEQDAIFIDAGISCRETERRMVRLGLDIRQVRAIFISHEHTDHTRGVEVIVKRYQVPVYITPGTHGNSRLMIQHQMIRKFSVHHPVQIGSLSISAFPKRHDAADPHSFIISDKGTTIGVFTDIGSSCDHVTRHFSQCHAAFLEANYDEQMLEHGPYPAHLKNRIRGNEGHLSNRQALELFRKHRHPELSHLILSHLSEQNNTPEIVYDLFQGYSKGVRIDVASRYRESEVFRIGERPVNGTLF